ncbi:MAG: DUF721 domain-containing protein [Bacillota bacterium]|nr:DUF721 domain-containing protein [Bacillota bacterium]
MEPLRQSLWEALGQLGLKETAQRQQAVTLWSEAAGALLAQRCRALWVQGSTLWVEAESSSWAQQVALLKNRILSRLKHLGAEGIEDIRVKVGGRPLSAPSYDPPLEPQEIEEARRKLADMGFPQTFDPLQDALREWRVRLEAWQERRRAHGRQEE